MQSPIQAFAVLAFLGGMAAGQTAAIYQIGDPTPTGSVGVGGVSDAQQVIGTTGGGRRPCAGGR